MKCSRILHVLWERAYDSSNWFCDASRFFKAGLNLIVFNKTEKVKTFN